VWQALARTALPRLAHAQYGDSAPALVAAIKRKVRQQGTVQQLRILDAFGPNPNHPLQDSFLLTQLGALLAPRATVTITSLDIHSGRADGFGGQFGGFGGSTGKTATSGLGGMGGFVSGVTARPSTKSSSYLPAVQIAFGIRLRTRTVLSLAEAQRSWELR
jgi:hypothetical protein